MAWTLFAAAVFSVAPARAETVNVSIDQARLIKMPDSVATIVIGNPLVADASLQAGGILVLTGKNFGSTNLLALDRTGRASWKRWCRCRAKPAPIWSWFIVALRVNPMPARRTANLG